MNIHSSTDSSNSSQRLHESEYELFRARLVGKLCVALVCLGQVIARIVMIFWYFNENTKTSKITAIHLSFPVLMILTIATEYFLFKKRGPKIIRFSIFFDIILLLLYLGDWTVGVITSFSRIEQTDPPSFKVTAVYGITSFSWRTLLVTLIVQKWQLKIIPPIVAMFMTTGFTLYYDRSNIHVFLLRMGIQLFNIIIILYCEDKLKWRMIWTNLYREKWIQMNHFILNNVPENIMILDAKGEAKFISDSCKSFIKKCLAPTIPTLDIQEFFKRIQDLNQQYDTDLISPCSISALSTAKQATGNSFLEKDRENESKAETLEELLANFHMMIKEKNLQEKQFIIYNGKLRTRNNKEKSIEVKISFTQHFKNHYIILILRDTTQRDHLVRLKETNKYKDQLLASVSHELRAPLNGNINLLETAISSSKIPENMKETLLIPALRSSKILMHLINDMLDMSQIKEKKLRLLFQAGNLEETLKNTAQLVEIQAARKELEFKIEIDPNLPKSFCTDHLRLSQIVLNLLANAVKFTRQGTVTLKIVPVDDTNWVKIIVEDSGIGISKDNLHKLFSAYTRIEFEGRQEMNPTGVGLGLSIASYLADLLSPKNHAGINVKSVPEQGSIFSFMLENKERAQVFQTEELQKDLEKSSSSSSSLSFEIAKEFSEVEQIKFRSPKTIKSQISISLPPFTTYTYQSETLIEARCSCAKVLVVDDNPFNTMAFEAILNSLDVKCDSVFSGPSAIKKLLGRQEKRCGKTCIPYAVIFMDQEMPEMTGTETVKEIKKLQNKKVLPGMRLIGCTAHKAKEEVDRFLEAGLEQCIHKPISKIMIHEILKESS